MKKGACPGCGLRFKKGRMAFVLEQGSLERKIVCPVCASRALLLVVPENLKSVRAVLKPFADHMARLADVYRLSGQEGLAHGYEHAAGMLEDGRAVSPTMLEDVGVAYADAVPSASPGNVAPERLPKRPPPPSEPRAAPPAAPPTNGAAELSPCESAILSALASRKGTSLSRAELAFASCYSPESGGYSKALGRLRTLGYIAGPSHAIARTAEGIAHTAWMPLPVGDRLLEVWVEKAGTCAGTLLATCVREYPKELSREELAEKSGYSAESGGFSKALGHLRGLDLLKGLRPSDEFMATIALKARL